MKIKQLLFTAICLLLFTQTHALTPFGSQGLSWNLENGILTISKTGDGTGEMPNYVFGNQVPWYSMKENVSQLVIEDGVTSIGAYAFEQFPLLTSVTLSQTVKHIGAYAFFCCSGLTSIILPEGLESLGYKSFHYCTGLQSVTIPGSVTIIRHENFAGCKNLRDVYVEATTPPICKENVFSGIPSDCKLHVPESSMRAYAIADIWKYFIPILTSETAIEKIALTTIQIYPNPATDGFFISGIENESAKLTLTNVNGMVVISQTIRDNEYISVSSLPAGLYMVKIDTTNGAIVKKLIRQ